MMNRPFNEGGFILLLTLWILAILSALLISFSMAVSSNVKEAGYQRDDTEALLLARSALNRISSALAQPDEMGMNAEMALIRGEHLGLWYVDPDDWSLSRDPVADEESEVRIVGQVSAEDSKLPLLKLNASMLGKLPNMNPVLADRIAAYVAERGKENPPRFVEELLRVDEVSGKIYYEKKNENDLIKLLTTFSDGKVFINAASPEILSVLPGVDQDLAAEFAELLEQEKYLERVESLRGVLGVTPTIYKLLKPWVKTKPSYHRVQVSVEVRGINRRAEGIYKIDRGEVTPLYISGG